MVTKQILDNGRRRLGRGLSSLIGDPVPVSIPANSGMVTPAPSMPGLQSNGVAPQEAGVRHLSCVDIVPSPYQPRREMDQGGLERLADSIRRSGLMQPVIVRPHTRATGARYELVAGERRWRAAQMAGLTAIPALVRSLSDEESAEWALVENLQREDLNPMDRGASLKLMCERFGLRQEEVAARVGMDRSTVANLIRLTDLEPQLAALIAAGALTAGHGRALLSLPPGDPRVTLGTRSSDERWSVRRLESEVAALLTPRVSNPANTDPFDARASARQDVERRLTEHLGTKVSIATDRSGSRGRITIEFYGLDHFEGLLTKLGLPRE